MNLVATPTTSRLSTESAFRAERARADFPLLRAGDDLTPPLVYLDNAATAQKPEAVLARMDRFFREENANIHRGVYKLSVAATAAYDEARERVARFLGTPDPREIVFTRGATESVNLVAQTFGRQRVGPGDEILLSLMEHHANFVPWHMLAQATGARVRVMPTRPDGSLDWEQGREMLGERTRLVAICQASNSLGTVNPVEEIITAAHARGVPVLVDAAQSVVHGGVNARALDCDFLVFSGHKVFGPTGIGVLYGKRALLESMPPWQTGGDMIERVTVEGATFAGPPERFEAGTPHMAGAVGLAAALDWMEQWDPAGVAAHEQDLLRTATARLEALPGVEIIGRAAQKIPVLSFRHREVHPHDLATFLDTEGVAVRAGHHCCQPLMTSLGISGTVRASFALYNTLEDVERFAAALARTLKFFT